MAASIGRQQVVEDALPAYSASALAATLDREEVYAPGAELPPLWHWVYFLTLDKTADLAENGHTKHGGFIPAMSLPRRVFAGARIEFRRPLRLGRAARRVSTIADMRAKQGASGDLIFLLMRNEFLVDEEIALIEEQDIVFRAPPVPGAIVPASKRATGTSIWTREVSADERLLFRYSALIFNAHRIHWDRPYACGKEGYPGLVVHGQLIATWLADLVRRNTERRLASFRFRSMGALYDETRCRLCGIPDRDSVTLWAEDAQGSVVMEARADF